MCCAGVFASIFRIVFSPSHVGFCVRARGCWFGRCMVFSFSFDYFAGISIHLRRSSVLRGVLTGLCLWCRSSRRLCVAFCLQVLFFLVGRCGFRCFYVQRTLVLLFSLSVSSAVDSFIYHSPYPRRISRCMIAQNARRYRIKLDFDRLILHRSLSICLGTVVRLG